MGKHGEARGNLWREEDGAGCGGRGLLCEWPAGSGATENERMMLV